MEYRHTHELVDQIFSRISLKLASHHAITFEQLAYWIHHSFDPKHNVEILKRTFNIKHWIWPAMEAHWNAITEARNFFIEKCQENENEACVSIRTSADSAGRYGPRMFPLKRLPVGRPQYNPARLIFSRWEKGGKARTCDLQAMKDFNDSRKMICDPEGPCAAMTANERENWEKYFEETDIEQHKPAEDIEPGFWIPETKADVVAHLNSIAKPKTQEEIHAGDYCFDRPC